MKQHKRIKRGDAVRINWHDSASTKGWDYTENPGTLGKIVSQGFVVENHPDYLTLSTSLSTAAACIDPLSVPWSCIQELKKLPSDWDRNPPRRKR